MTEIQARFLQPLFLIGSVIVFGTVGFMLIEGWDVLDAAYMTVITITTIGFSEVYPLSVNGRLFTIFLALVGVGTVFYVLGIWARFVLEGELRKGIGRRRMEKKIDTLKDHFIVCGYGRMGKIVCRELRVLGKPYVIVDHNDEEFQDVPEGVLYYHGDATDDAVLLKLGVKRAKSLLSVVSSDAENLFVVLSARALNPDLLVVARANSESAVEKMRHAGANRVVSANQIGARSMVASAIRPTVMDFIELATLSGNLDVQIEEVNVREGSVLADKTISECELEGKMNVVMVAIKKHHAAMEFNPTSSTVIEPGDVLIVLGDTAKLLELEGYASNPS